MEPEHRAWTWLAGLDRKTTASSQAEFESQIRVTMLPGNLGSDGADGAIVRVTTTHPKIQGTASGAGRSLFAACEKLRSELLNGGADVPPIK